MQLVKDGKNHRIGSDGHIRSLSIVFSVLLQIFFNLNNIQASQQTITTTTAAATAAATITTTSTTKTLNETQIIIQSPETNEVQLIDSHPQRKQFIEIKKLRNKCLSAEKELDRCSAQLIGLGQTGPLYPDTMQELNSQYCPKFRQTVACIKDNSDCFKPFERQIINWILTSTRRMNYKRCRDEGEKEKFLRLTNSCLATMRSPMDDCMAQYISHLDAIADFEDRVERLSENDVQIQLSCCANRRFKQCIMNSAKQACKSNEGLRKLRRTNSLSSQRVARKQMDRIMSEAMEDLKSTLERMALTGPEFICNNIDEKFCRAKFDGRFSGRISRHKSIVPAMLKIYSNK